MKHHLVSFQFCFGEIDILMVFLFLFPFFFGKKNTTIGFQFLHFIRTECRGGANALIDMNAAVNRLREQHPDAFDTLCRTKFTFHFKVIFLFWLVLYPPIEIINVVFF